MGPTHTAAQMLERVRSRLTIRTLAHRTFVGTLWLGGVYLVALLIGRLTGLYAEWFPLWSVVVVPTIAAVVSLLIPQRPTQLDAARLVDRFHDTKDLFLTWVDGTRDQSSFAPLVVRDAEKLAASVEPQKVVAYHWEHPALIASGSLCALLLAAFLVPTLDPFGKVAEATQVDQQRKLLEESRQQTTVRRAELKEKGLDEENSENVGSATEKLKLGFQQLEKGDRQKNQQRLNAHQKEIGEMFRKLNSGELKSLFDKAKGDQQLGIMEDQELFKQWQRDLQQGKGDSLLNELQELQKEMKELAKSDDPVERTEKEREIKKKLQQLQKFSENKVGSQALSNALERAQQQLDAAKNQELTEQAMEALTESMELAQEEVKLLAQAARDLESLEEALEMISMSKRLNAEDELDGEMFDGEMTLEDYQEMYAQLMAQMGNGEGTGGQGMGDSESVPEDDTIESGFKDEQSKSAIQQGKILMSMKTKGLSESGEMKDEEFVQAVSELKRSLDDVIDQEDIPPGYHDGIKKYFDTLKAEKPAD